MESSNSFDKLHKILKYLISHKKEPNKETKIHLKTKNILERIELGKNKPALF